MPVTYYRANDGNVYPTYSGASANQQVRQYYLTHAGQYGLTTEQMRETMNGHPNAWPSPQIQQQYWEQQNPPDPHQLLPVRDPVFIWIMFVLIGLFYALVPVLLFFGVQGLLRRRAVSRRLAAYRQVLSRQVIDTQNDGARGD